MVFPWCSGRELVTDLSLDMNETMFAVFLPSCDAGSTSVLSLVARHQCYGTAFRGRSVIATKNVRG